MAQQFIIQAFITVFLIVLLECLLSTDNIVVISKIANKAGNRRNEVIRYGMIGAFVFRGLSLFAVSFLINNPDVGNWIKLVGALYLLKLVWSEWTPEEDSLEEGDTSTIDKLLIRFGISGLLLIILECELIDLVFSIDQIFTTVAFTQNIKDTYTLFGYVIQWSITLTIIGVFLGILALRISTVYFMKLIDKYPVLNKSALIVIAVVGFKLLLGSGLSLTGWLPNFNHILESHTTDFVISFFMLGVFFFPVLYTKYKTSRTNV